MKQTCEDTCMITNSQILTMELSKLSNFNVVQLTFLIIVFINLCNCCFIRNCPPGGKRSMDILPHPTRQCMSCGPDMRGQCVGPDICCGPFGCLMGTMESSSCQNENKNTVACSISGTPCGIRNQGKCVADGICCSSGACSFNTKCKSNTAKNSQQILSLLNNLFQTGEYDNIGMS